MNYDQLSKIVIEIILNQKFDKAIDILQRTYSLVIDSTNQ